MKQLICTGDSLADIWPSHAKQMIDHDEFFVYQIGGGSLDLQIKSLLNHFIKYPIVKNYIIVSQFTGMGRISMPIDNDLAEVSDNDNMYIFENHLSNTTEYLANNSKKHTYVNMDEKHIYNSGHTRVRDLVAVHCLLSRLGADVRVFRGWLGVMPAELWKQCCEMYDRDGVSYTDKTLVETAVNISVDEKDWIDEFHPDDDLSRDSLKIVLDSIVLKGK